MNELNIFTWLSQWYKSNCNGDWEHDYGILIETIDNPGWSISIDLESTEIGVDEIEWSSHVVSDNDWYGFKVKNGKYEASGDPSKLEFLLRKFRELVLQNGGDKSK